MAGNTFGNLFRVTTFGESHGGYVGCVVDGCPPGLKLSKKDIQKELDRRKPGQSTITTPRKEEDTIDIVSGVFEGKTTGTPILLLAKNKNARPSDYIPLKDIFRPSHADYTYIVKYGLRDYYGSGRASARETLARVAAGAVAKKYLNEKMGIEIVSYVEQVGAIKTNINHRIVTPAMVDSNIIRCPDDVVSKKMIELIHKIMNEGDSIGGIIKCVIRNVAAGYGEPVFNKLSSDLGCAMLSINAVKGFDIGAGFDSVGMKGSEHNDSFYVGDQGRVRTQTNNSGGVQGGISNGEDIYCRVAFKPVSTIRKKQYTISKDLKPIELAISGRHDPCVLPRAVPIVDAMAALVIMDHCLRRNSYSI